MRKFLLSSLLSVALIGQASAATLNWTLPVFGSGPSDLVAIQLYDLAGSPPANVMIGSVGPTVTTFTTAPLPPGSSHTFTAVAVYGEGSAAPSNAVLFTVPLTLAPITNLTVSP